MKGDTFPVGSRKSKCATQAVSLLRKKSESRDWDIPIHSNERQNAGDDTFLKQLSCKIIFLSFKILEMRRITWRETSILFHNFPMTFQSYWHFACSFIVWNYDVETTKLSGEGKRIKIILAIDNSNICKHGPFKLNWGIFPLKRYVQFLCFSISEKLWSYMLSMDSILGRCDCDLEESIYFTLFSIQPLIIV